MLPSFWADTFVSVGNKTGLGYWLLIGLGTILSMALIIGALYMLRIAVVQRKKVKKMLDKFLNGAS
jgi:hypothetical protein